MQKIINFRSIFILFVVSLLTIFFSVKVNVSLFYLFGLIIPILWLLYIVHKKKYGLTVVSVLLLSFFFVYSCLFIKNYNNKSLENQNLVISGYVTNVNNVSNNFSYITLNKIQVLNEKNEKLCVNGNVSVSYANCDNSIISLGDKIIFSSNLEAIDILINGKVNSYYLSKDIRYEVTSTIQSSDIVLVKGNLPLNEVVKEYNKELLINNLGSEKGNLALGILYGDRSDVDDNLLNIFKT